MFDIPDDGLLEPEPSVLLPEPPGAPMVVKIPESDMEGGDADGGGDGDGGCKEDESGQNVGSWDEKRKMVHTRSPNCR
jgi:hypothetical protein